MNYNVYIPQGNEPIAVKEIGPPSSSRQQSPWRLSPTAEAQTALGMRGCEVVVVGMACNPTTFQRNAQVTAFPDKREFTGRLQPWAACYLLRPVLRTSVFVSSALHQPREAKTPVG